MAAPILYQLTDEEKSTFHMIINSAVAERTQCQFVVAELEAAIPGKKFSMRTIYKYLTKLGWVPSPRSQAHIETKPFKSCVGAQKIPAGDSCQITGGGEQQEVELFSERVVTLDDALAKANVDLTKWDVERFVVNSWEVGAKGPDKRVLVTPLWQVKVWLKAKKGWNPSEFKKILLEDFRKLAPTYKAPVYHDPIEPTLLELSIFDAHFGKLAWSPESGQNYDLNICRDRYMKAGRDLLARGSMFNPSRILYVVGNDFFHVDHKGGTANGTPQDCDGRWQKAFRIGKDCCIRLIEEATAIAPVDVMCIPGNHDREKVFCLGEVLAARFLNHPAVNVVNDPDMFNYYRWGKVLLGFVHGDNHMNANKRADLPGQMLSDRPVDCGETVWREWHLGHRHHEEEMVWKYRSVDTIRDIAVRTLPSLSSTDAWHRSQGYCSILAAEAHLYHQDKGRIGYLVHCTEA